MTELSRLRILMRCAFVLENLPCSSVILCALCVEEFKNLTTEAQRVTEELTG